MKETIVTAANFEEEVLKEERLVLVDFWATWCGPCKALAKELEQFAEETDDVKVAKIDVDAERELAIRFGIQVIPTMLLFKGGKELKRRSGYCLKAEIEAFAKGQTAIKRLIARLIEQKK